MVIRRAIPILTLFMLACSSFGQDCLGTLVVKVVNCCGFGMVESMVCQGSTGSSCQELVTFRQCSPSCSIGVAGSCGGGFKAKAASNPMGSVVEVPAQVSTFPGVETKQGGTCSQPFEDWLQKTMASRKVN